MSFVSLQFLIFLPVVLLLHKLLPHKFRWIMLLVASYYFYMSWNVYLIFLILAATTVSYVSGLLMGKTESRAARIFFLTFTLAVCLGLLIFFKYFNFLSDSVVALINLMGMNLKGPALDILLPVGISFYTFQTLSYVIDVYRKKIEPEKHFGYFALFVSFFPQLVAGPIERPENLLPQLKRDRAVTGEDASEGVRLLISGFFRKVVIADTLAVFVDAVYAAPSEAGALSVLVATVFFAVQIYCDFAGYSEIAMGCARLMGIKLMKNFDRPYSAASIRGFWRRWHISLTGWFTDYVYIPLGGSRKGSARRCVNTLAVFLLSGLWHGANWTFVMWGGLHGIYAAAEILLKKPWDKLKTALKIRDGAALNGFRRAVTFILVCFAWIFFRAQTPAEAFTLIGRLFTAWDGAVLSEIFSGFYAHGAYMLQALLAVVSLPFVPRLLSPPAEGGEEDGQTLSARSSRTAVYVIAVAAVALCWLIMLSGNRTSSFIYFQF